MTEIPEDVMKAAGEIANGIIANYERNMPANLGRNLIARAILAERERCLDIAVAARDEWAKGAEICRESFWPNASRNYACMENAASLIAWRINNA